MNEKIIDFFDDIFKEVVFDKKLAAAFYQFQVGFVNKNEEHMYFFGGNLLGVQVVRFTPSDYNKFFDEVLGIDVDALIERIKNCSSINSEWKVSSDEFNLTCFYCTHRFLTSRYLVDVMKYRAAKDTMLIYQYKVMASLLSHYFKYPADPQIAQATYAALSNRYLIKRLGSWSAVFSYRADEIVKEDGLHDNILRKFNDDTAIINAVNDTQGRVRDMVKNIFAEIKKIEVSGEKITTNTITDLTLDGNEIIKDKINGPDTYSKYIISVMSDQYTFIKEELFSIVVQAMPGLNSRMFRATLEWMSVESHGPNRIEVEHFIRIILLYTIDYLYKHGSLLKQTRDLVALTINIRNLYLASRSTDIELKEVRDLGFKLIRLVNKDLGESSLSTVRTAIILYICLRAFTKHHYHG